MENKNENKINMNKVVGCHLIYIWNKNNGKKEFCLVEKVHTYKWFDGVRDRAYDCKVFSFDSLKVETVNVNANVFDQTFNRNFDELTKYVDDINNTNMVKETKLTVKEINELQKHLNEKIKQYKILDEETQISDLFEM